MSWVSGATFFTCGPLRHEWFAEVPKRGLRQYLYPETPKYIHFIHAWFVLRLSNFDNENTNLWRKILNVLKDVLFTGFSVFSLRVNTQVLWQFHSLGLLIWSIYYMYSFVWGWCSLESQGTKGFVAQSVLHTLIDYLRLRSAEKAFQHHWFFCN
jgi:hypothetical protein